MHRLRTPRARTRLLIIVITCMTLLALSLTALQASARSATTFFVTNVNDTGSGSLRQAIIDANNNPGVDTIAFNISGTSRTIKPVLSLPSITDTVVIDGTTQPGFVGTPLVELNGVNAVSNAIGIGAPGSVVRGLVINGFSGGGISIRSASGGSRIEGCYIGTDITGTVAVPNSGPGVFISSSNNVIGGTTPSARNIISGNNSQGVEVEVFCCTGTTPSASGNIIEGNYIGLNAAGNAALPNMREGVFISTSSSEGTVANNIVGGSELGAGNVISGNRFDGLFIGSFQTTGTMVKGNFIGTDATGTFSIPNSGDGLRVDLARDNVIGGLESGARNVISGNGVNGSGTGGGNGITLGGSGNVVRGNYVGVNAAGDAPIPNFLHGVAVNGMNQTVGGVGAGEGNLIAFNGEDGIVCAASASAGNPFRGNSIFSNGAFAGSATIGIDLGAFGVTPNDAGDSDGGANNLQNFPVIASVTPVAGGVNVKGTLNSTDNTTFALDFYANSVCDASGNGEGARRIGSANVTTNAGGDAGFDITFPASLPANQVVTATATDPAGNTSEFSQCSQSSLTVGSVGFTASNVTVSEASGTASLTVNRTGGSAGTLTVGYSVMGVTATAGSDFTATQGVLTFADGETSKSFNVPILNDNLDEPFSETAKVTLSTSGDLDSLGSVSVATLSITDDDPPPDVSVGDVSATEGDSGTTDFNFPVTLSVVSARAVTVTFATADGTATAGSDYISTSGSLVIPAGQTSGTITVKVVGDAALEPDETFMVSLIGATNGNIVDGTGQGTINNDDSPTKVAVSVNDASVTEGNGGTTNAVFNVTLSAMSGQTVMVNYATADGTATAGSDYNATSGTLTFNPGETSKPVSVQVVGDALNEPDETFFVNLSGASNATVSDAQGLGTITNDDTPLVQFTQAIFPVTESANFIAITVTRSGDATIPVSVDYQTSDSTASARSDYTSASGTLHFASGDTSQSFVVLITDDGFSEPDETINLTLSNPSGGASLGTNNPTTIVIAANDNPPPQSNLIDTSSTFVRQHYHDFLNREPDQSGFAFWQNEINSCADQSCREVKRINVSAAFYLSIEFQETGFLVERMYKTAYGDATGTSNFGPTHTLPVPIVRLYEFLPDTQRIGQGVVIGQPGANEQLATNKNAFAIEFVQRQRFLSAFPLSMTSAQVVDKMNQNAGSVLTQALRDQLVAQLTASADVAAGRSSVLRSVAENATLKANETNRAFVLMQYFGYLRRNPNDPQDTDYSGFDFWLSKLNQFNSNFVQAEMVKAFITSSEYRQRFGQ